MNSTVVTIVIFGLTHLFAAVRAYYALKHEMQTQFATMQAAVSSEREKRHTEQADFKADITHLIVRVETSVSDLAHRVSTLEAGQDEWTKSLRHRMHELSDKMQTLTLDVDRLKRPTA